MKYALLVTLVGCGRIGFEDQRSTGDGAQQDGGCALGAWSAPVAVAAVNGTTTDFGAQVTGDGLTLYFDSDRDGTHDLFIATRLDRASPFSAPVKLIDVDTSVDEVDPSPSPDGLELMFSRNGCLLSARRAAATDSWSIPTVTSICGANGAFIANGGLTLYYNGDVDLKHQGTLYVSTRATLQDDFVPGVAIAELTSGRNKGYPALSGDELTMYFESYSAGMNLDLYQVTRASKAAAWGVPAAITELNTSADEVDPSITADGTELYFSSAVTGVQHIYRATRSCQ